MRGVKGVNFTSRFIFVGVYSRRRQSIAQISRLERLGGAMFEYEVFYDTLDESFYFLGPGGISPEEVKAAWLPVGFVVAESLPHALDLFDFEKADTPAPLNAGSAAEIPSGLMLDLIDMS